MRALVFLGSFVTTLAFFSVATTASWPFAVAMSACAAAIICTVATASGRLAGRRIVSNARTGWRSSKT